MLQLPGFPTVFARTVALSALLVVAACESFTDGTYLSCPRAVFLGGAETVTMYAPGGGRGVVDITVEAALDNLAATCRFSSQRVEAEIAFDIIASPGVAFAAGFADIPFFVAVLDLDGAVLVKTPFVTRVPLPPGGGAVTWTEELTQEILLSEGQNARGFEILVGLQLTAEQFEDNVARNARP